MIKHALQIKSGVDLKGPPWLNFRVALSVAALRALREGEVMFLLDGSVSGIWA